jgi:hypothetical protein
MATMYEPNAHERSGSDDLPDADVREQEIADDMQTALEQFSTIAEKLKG